MSATLDELGTRDRPVLVCPFCGGALQATVSTWLDVAEDGEVSDTGHGKTFKLYCENDCDEWPEAQDNDIAGELPTYDEIADVLTWAGQASR